ncbi:MAG: CoA transferase [Actinomycetia bacterium]|nr:CoA transferase [Actinomycetes bacterium]MCP5031389.1 CoA transferase [Actinomycetes bacterium]
MLLADIRVLDLTDDRGELGPWLLGRLGAEVIKVEPPGGTPARTAPPLIDAGPTDQRSLQFAAYNDNKQSVVLDLSDDKDRAHLLDLVAGSEIVFDSGPPGVLAGAGFSEEELVAANPELVHVLVTPFGIDGPRADQPASDLTLAALGGPMSLQGVRERAPLKISVPQVWRHTGAESVNAALVAYRVMQRTGQPQWVDVSAQTTMTWTMLNAMEAHEVQGFDFERAGSTVALAVAVDLRRQTKDGYVIMAPIGAMTTPILGWLIDEGIAPNSWLDVDWDTYDHRALSGEAVDPSFDDLRQAVDTLCARYTRQEMLTKGLALGATFAPINTIGDLLAVEHLDRRSFWADVDVAADTGETSDEDDTVVLRRTGNPITVDGDRPAQTSRVPAIDADGPRLRSEGRRTRRASVAGTAPDDPLPLAGIKVADFSWIGVGPITAKCLADHGATVVRIESENRLDGLRAQAPFKDAEFGLNRSNFYGTFNTSKLSMSIDLTTEAGVGLARRMTQWADIVIDSFRPGTMEGLGLGPDVIRAADSSTITATTSLLGGGGPLSSLAGYGFHAAAFAGFTELVGWPDLGPDGPWMAYTDTIAPRFLTAAVLAAIDRRDRTGEGCHIEAAQLEVGLQLLAPEILDHQRRGTVYGRIANRDPYLAPQGAYPCVGDDEWCTITIPDDGGWRRLVAAMGNPPWAQDPTHATMAGRQDSHDAIDRGISSWTATMTAEEVERVVSGVGIPAGKVQRSRDLAVDAQYLHRRFYHRLEHGEVGLAPYAGHQYKIRGYDHGPRFAGPVLGDDTFTVMTEMLAMDSDDIAEAAAGGALG